MPLVLMIIGGLIALAAFSGDTRDWSPAIDSYRPLGIGFGALLITLGVAMWCWQEWLDHANVRARIKSTASKPEKPRVDLNKRAEE